jgi:phytoene dehydrogenase-like protein
MERYDAIVLGGGMGGLSAAAFLAATGRSVALLEKHDKVGGLASSFEAGGARFDLGIEGLRELAPGSHLAPFLRWWGAELPLETRKESLLVHTARGSYAIRGESAREDLRVAFPASARAIDRFFNLNAAMMAEMSGGGAPKPPYETRILEKIGYGLASLRDRPKLLRYGLRNSSSVLSSLFDDPELIRVIASKTLEDIVYMAVAYRWDAFSSGEIMYPSGGMGALPEAVARSITKRGGEIFLRAEAMKIEAARGGYRAACPDGRSFSARALVIAAPMPWAAFALFENDERFSRLRSAVRRRRVFPGYSMEFIALDPGFPLGDANYVMDWGKDEGKRPDVWRADSDERDSSPANAPFACVVAGTGAEPGRPRALSVLTRLGWDHASRWGTASVRGEDRYAFWRGAPEGYRASEAYRALKRETENAILERLARRLGPGFMDAVRYTSFSTPLSFARYTNNPGGSFMGFSIRAGEYGRFFPQRGPIPGLYLAGQWTFPGFGVAGVAASGYYAARALLADEGDDLDARLRALD